MTVDCEPMKWEQEEVCNFRVTSLKRGCWLFTSSFPQHPLWVGEWICYFNHTSSNSLDDDKAIRQKEPPPHPTRRWPFAVELPLLSGLPTSVQFSSVAQSCPTLWNPMNCSTPGFPVHHQLPEFIQTCIHRVSDAIQASHPLSSPSSPAPNPSQHQSLFQWVNFSHEGAKVLEFQL